MCGKRITVEGKSHLNQFVHFAKGGEKGNGRGKATGCPLTTFTKGVIDKVGLNWEGKGSREKKVRDSSRTPTTCKGKRGLRAS